MVQYCLKLEHTKNLNAGVASASWLENETTIPELVETQLAVPPGQDAGTTKGTAVYLARLCALISGANAARAGKDPNPTEKIFDSFIYSS